MDLYKIDYKQVSKLYPNYTHVYTIWILVWMYSHKKELQNVIGVTCVFFAFTVYLTSILLSEFCHIYLNFTAVGRNHEVYRELL